MDGNFRFPVQFLVLQTDFVDQRHYIAPAYAEFLVLRLCLSEFQYLVDKVQQPDGTLMDDGYLLSVFGRQ